MLEKRLKLGNFKLHQVLIFDLPAINSCLNCKDCMKACYAVKAQKQYPNVRKWRQENFDLAKHYPKALVGMLAKQLKHTKYKVVRIHSSGDFFSQEYITLWEAVVAAFPGINFYAYTKVDKILDFSKLCALPNFNLIPSFINGKLNFGKKDYCEELVKTEGAFLCPASLDNKIKCNKECNYCLTKNKPVFIQH